MATTCVFTSFKAYTCITSTTCLNCIMNFTSKLQVWFLMVKISNVITTYMLSQLILYFQFLSSTYLAASKFFTVINVSSMVLLIRVFTEDVKKFMAPETHIIFNSDTCWCLKFNYAFMFIILSFNSKCKINKDKQNNNHVLLPFFTD